MQRQIPGYSSETIEGVWFRGRRDQVEVGGSEISVYGASTTELWMAASEPINEPVLFEVRTLAADNRVTLSIGDSRATAVFADADEAREQIQIVELLPSNPELYRPVEIVPNDEPPGYLYQLKVHSETGRRPRDANGNVTNDFYFGAGIRYLGTRERVHGSASYLLEWKACEAPATVTVGTSFQAGATVRNSSPRPWARWGLTRIALSYHWQRDGEIVVFDGIRTRLPNDVKSGDTLSTEVNVEAPSEPGSYVLQLDLVRETIGWFSDHNDGALCEARVEVVPPA